MLHSISNWLLKLGLKVREQQWGRAIKRLDSIARRFGWDRVPAMDRRSELDTPTHIYYNDGSAWYSRNCISHQEFAHRISIIFASAGAFGAGLAQLIYQFFGN
jgi:hypothetical protein